MIESPRALPIGLMPRTGAGLFARDVRVWYGSVDNYRARVRALGAVRHWFLGDAATTPAQDEITTDGSGDGTYLGAPTVARGMLPEFGLATAFDGIDDRVRIPSGLPAGPSNFTIVFLVRLPSIPTVGQNLFTTGLLVTSPHTPYLNIGPTGRLTFSNSVGTVTSAAPLTPGVPTLVAATYEQAGTLATLALAPALGPFQIAQAAVGTFAVVDPANGGIAGHNLGGFFRGDMQGVATFPRALSLAELESLRAAATWQELAGPTVNDLEDADPLIIDAGIHEDKPLARIAASGICTFTLDNSELHGAAIGRYSPGHVNGRPGWDRGAMILVQSVTSTSTAPLFVGTVRTIKPTAGVHGPRRVQVMATDWLDEAARRPVHGIETLINVRANQVILRLVTAMRNRPHALALATGTDIYPFVLDSSARDSDSIFRELKRVADSERGLIYMRGDGTLCFENRNDRQIFASATFELQDVLGAELTRAADDVINRVAVTLHPRRVDASPTTILYSADTVQQYESTGLETLVWLRFRDPLLEATQIGGIDIQPLTAITDYLINSAADGSGVNLTTDPRVTIRMFAEAGGAHLVITNMYGAAVFVTKLQIRGRGLYHYDPITVIAQDAGSIESVGSQQVSFDMPYQTRIGVAESTAQQMLNTYLQAPTRVDAVPFWLFENPMYEQLGIEGQISTRTWFREPMGAITGTYFLNAKRLELRAAGDVNCTVWLTPTDALPYARFDISHFDAPGARFAF